MNPQSWSEWVAWAGLMLPLIVLAGSVAFYVRNEIKKSQEGRYEKFWQLMVQAGAKDGNIAAKMAAFYEMRKYPQYADVVIRLCEGATVQGTEGALLKEEMMKTAEYLRNKK